MEQTERAEMQDVSGHDLILSSRVVGTRVYNRNGDRLGHIDDLSIQRADGQRSSRSCRSEAFWASVRSFTRCRGHCLNTMSRKAAS